MMQKYKKMFLNFNYFRALPMHKWPTTLQTLIWFIHMWLAILLWLITPHKKPSRWWTFWPLDNFFFPNCFAVIKEQRIVWMTPYSVDDLIILSTYLRCNNITYMLHILSDTIWCGWNPCICLSILCTSRVSPLATIQWHVNNNLGEVQALNSANPCAWRFANVV